MREIEIAPEEIGVKRAAIASPKGGVVVGPFKGTELYVDAGLGFHSNDARGATITRDPGTGEAVDPVTPLVRAKGAEVGVRTVAVPHLQTSVAVWTLAVASPGEAMSVDESVEVPASGQVELHVGGGATLSGRVTGNCRCRMLGMSDGLPTDRAGCDSHTRRGDWRRA